MPTAIHSISQLESFCEGLGPEDRKERCNLLLLNALFARRHRAEQFDILFGVVWKYTAEQEAQGLISSDFAQRWRNDINYDHADRAEVETRLKRSLRFLEDRSRYEATISNNWGYSGLQALYHLQSHEYRDVPFSRDLAHQLGKFTDMCDSEKGLELLECAMMKRINE